MERQELESNLIDNKISEEKIANTIKIKSSPVSNTLNEFGMNQIVTVQLQEIKRRIHPKVKLIHCQKKKDCKLERIPKTYNNTKVCYREKSKSVRKSLIDKRIQNMLKMHKINNPFRNLK
eukprot:403352769